MAAAEADWLDDAQGRPLMNRRLFFAAIFQLADLWVDSVEENDYVKFLKVRFRYSVMLQDVQIDVDAFHIDRAPNPTATQFLM